MKKEELVKLAEKIHNMEATTEEVKQYNDWFNSFRHNEDFVLLDADEKRIAMLNRINEHISAPKNKITRLWPRMAVAVGIVVMLSTGVLFYKGFFSGLTPQMPAGVQEIYDIEPGSNKATLTLSNGLKVDLNSVANGELAQELGVQITKSKDGQLIYTLIPDQNTQRHVGEPKMNTIETPKGGQYQIVLPDGTEVWLNAASTLNFPANFADSKRRKVQLKGEAYFHVAKDPHKPFLVKTEAQEVVVLGTRFNIKAYEEEATIKTTLVEGSVCVMYDAANNGLKLKPGEQSLLRSGRLNVQEVDTDEAIAWKNGDFMFNNQELEGIMNQIARWYDVDVIYQNDEIRKKRFNGAIAKFNTVSKVLKMLELTGHVRFRIEQNSITVMN